MGETGLVWQQTVTVRRLETSVKTIVRTYMHSSSSQSSEPTPSESTASEPAASDQSLPITFRAAADPKLLQATQKARETFKYFWKEVALDFSRTVPALSLAAVKVAFSDDLQNPDAPVEHMWVEQIDFDGTTMTGVLLNSPNALTSIAEGDQVAFPFDRLGDWIGVMAGKVYGAYTVQAIRAGMDADERSRYDASWGLNFPAPDTVHTFDGKSPFETVIAKEMRKQIPKNRSLLKERFDGGRSLLHLEALYGRQESLEVLLNLGADRRMVCDRNWTALDYAKALNWTAIVQRLEEQPDHSPETKIQPVRNFK